MDNQKQEADNFLLGGGQPLKPTTNQPPAGNNKAAVPLKSSLKHVIKPVKMSPGKDKI